MMGLLGKEWRVQKPFFFLIAFIYGAGLPMTLISGYPDQQSLLGNIGILSGDESIIALIMFLLSFSLAGGLLMREQDQSTLTYLDALPTSRTRVFLTKVILGLTILISGPLMEILVAMFFHGLSRTSLTMGFESNLLLTAMAMQAAVFFAIFCLGLLLSFLRLFAWLLVAMLVVSHVALERHLPAVSYLDPMTLLTPRLEGHYWVVPWQSLTLQLSLGLLCLLLSWYLFLGGGFRFSNGLAKIRKNTIGRLFLTGAGVMGVVVWVVLVAVLMDSGDDSDDSGEAQVIWADWRVNRAYAGPYVFILPANLESAAQPMIDQAGTVHHAVRDFMNAEPQDEIIVDATTITGPHSAGLAFGTSIKLNLATVVRENQTRLSALLAHETTHVYAEILSESRMAEYFNSTRFFHEGLAEYVEHRFFPLEEGDVGRRLKAVIPYDREQFELEDLFDNNALTAKHDTNLVYSLGERFMTALVFRYGDRAPGDILRAMARDDAPKDLQGVQLWRDTFQAAGFNFDEAANAFYDLLSRDREELQEKVDRVPEFFAVNYLLGDKIVLEPMIDAGVPGELAFRIRKDSDSKPSDYRLNRGAQEEVLLVPKDSYPNGFDYQMGWLDPETGVTIWNPWVRNVRSE